MNKLQITYYNIKLKKHGIHVSRYFATINNAIYDIAAYDKETRSYILSDGENSYYWKPSNKYPTYIELV